MAILPASMVRLELRPYPKKKARLMPFEILRNLKDFWFRSVVVRERVLAPGTTCPSCLVKNVPFKQHVHEATSGESTVAAFLLPVAF